MLTVLLLASPIPTHPSPELILTTIRSLDFLGIDDAVPLVIAHDAPRPGGTQKVVAAYNEYLVRLRDALASRPHVSIIVSDRWGHLSGNIANALPHVTAPFMLVCQHDFAFARRVDLAPLLSAMTVRPDIRHVRFNKNDNYARVWDCDPPRRRRYYTEMTVSTSDGDVRLIRTIGWSDNNHLCRTTYYTDVVLPIIGRRHIHPEHAANLAAGPGVHDVLGTYIYGGIGEPAVLAHLDGRGSGGNPPSPGDNQSPTALQRFVRLNKVRFSVAVDRIVFKARVRQMKLARKWKREAS